MADDDSNVDLEWVIYHLTMNDDEDFTSVPLDVDLCRVDDDQWQRLLVGLRRNTTLTGLELTRGLQRTLCTDGDLEDLFGAIRRVPKLTKIRLDSFSTDDLRTAWGLFWTNEIMIDVTIENVRVVTSARPNRFDDTHAAFLVSMTQRSLKKLG